MLRQVKRVFLALALVGALGTAVAGDASAGKTDGQAQREARSQAGGTEVQKGQRPQPNPEPGAPGCAGARAINTNPPQASGTNAAFPNGNAAPQGGGPFAQCPDFDA